jgi:hypothetical protein
VVYEKARAKTYVFVVYKEKGIPRIVTEVVIVWVAIDPWPPKKMRNGFEKIMNREINNNIILEF